MDGFLDIWRPLCDLLGCRDQVGDDTFIEVDVMVFGRIRTARLHLCPTHHDLCKVEIRPGDVRIAAA